MVHNQRIRVRGFGDGHLRPVNPEDDAYGKALRKSRIRGSIDAANRLKSAREITNNEWDLYFAETNAGRLTKQSDGTAATIWAVVLVVCVTVLSFLLVHLISTAPTHASSTTTPASKRRRNRRVSTNERKKVDAWSADAVDKGSDEEKRRTQASDVAEPSTYIQPSTLKTLNHRKIVSSNAPPAIVPPTSIPTPGAPYPHPGGFYMNPTAVPAGNTSKAAPGATSAPGSTRGSARPLSSKSSPMRPKDLARPPMDGHLAQAPQFHQSPVPKRTISAPRAQPLSTGSSLPSITSNENLSRSGTPPDLLNPPPLSPSVNIRLPLTNLPSSATYDDSMTPTIDRSHTFTESSSSLLDMTPRIGNKVIRTVPEHSALEVQVDANGAPTAVRFPQNQHLKAGVPFVPPLQPSSLEDSGGSLSPPRSVTTADLGLPVPKVLIQTMSPPDPESGNLTGRFPEQLDNSSGNSKAFAMVPAYSESHEEPYDPLGILDGTDATDGDSVQYEPNDPRPGIKHERDNLTSGTDSTSSLQGAIQFEELKMVEVIGGGGFGQVWKANWLGTPVAVKVLTGSAQSVKVPRAVLEEFAAEINLLRGMRHPNICLYIGAVVTPPNRAIVTELASNGSLWDALRLPLAAPYAPCDGQSRRGTWPDILYQPDPKIGAPPILTTGRASVSRDQFVPPKGSWSWYLVKKVATGAARGMAYLHSGGSVPVLHRDMKSANILLDDSYTPKVCDFGLSRLKAQDQSMTGNCGTVQWMSPEVLANKPYNEKADVYSYGIICWELLSRECPFDGMTAVECAMAVLTQGKRPEVPKWCPPGFNALIRTCIKTNPQERPTFSQVLEALDRMP